MHRIDLEELPPLLDVPTAATVLGIGRSLAYQLVATNQWPTPVLRIGKLIKIPTAPLLHLVSTGPVDCAPSTGGAGSGRVDLVDPVSR